ncbi:ligase-associated DNA damage response endonuclease PdeM [Portibacter lacus]|uniref:DEAD/DEAH box helicase n=1 Tax=Portibacter lacus TaxID=1099794 RepID=A0AA37SNP0_9BACT|nr:ligase-associated DNA damage response endonuclease PdeM [Portibacter lacus]GLR16552.1 DEAD/DEAH box helicase [Portibacter lacus]
MNESLCEDYVEIMLQGEQLTLLSERAIYWKTEKCLLIADLHIGKVTHFRNNNIPIPQSAAQKNFDQLEKLILKHTPKTVYFMGDLFHSFYNKEWEVLVFLLAKFKNVEFELITGNHDILKQEHYESAGISSRIQKAIGPFMLTHHPENHKGYYNLCGHIHPGIKMRGSGRQYMKLPCFYFGEKQGILPAFGSFTGTAAIKVKNNDQVYAIFNEQIMKLNT